MSLILIVLCSITAGLKSLFKSKNKLLESELTSPKAVVSPVEVDARPMKSPSVDVDSKTLTPAEEPKDAIGSYLSNVNNR